MRHVPNFVALTVLASAGMASASAQNLAPTLRPLGIAVGTWRYNGENLPTPDQKASKWQWLEKCRWADNDAFMACSFVMNGTDGVVKSLAVSTYNDGDKSYWHYEAFNSGGDGGHPYIASMTVRDNTWTYDGKEADKIYRVIYHYDSPVKVTLRIELSRDSVHWTTVARGEGRKDEHP